MGPGRATLSDQGVEEELTVGLVYKICPRCFRSYPGLEMCPTPECAAKRTSPSYHRDKLDGELVTAARTGA